jgi:hypothetical protein
LALYQTIRDISADIRIKDMKANLISELQIKKGANFDARSLYYPASTFVGNYNRSKNKYGDLRPVYGINVLGFKMFERNIFKKRDNRGIRQYEFWDRYDDVGFPITFIVAFFEYTKTEFFTQNQLYWRDYFQDKKLPSEAPEYIRKAASIIEYANMNEEERYVIDALEMAEADMLAQLEYAKDEGIKEGRKEGREEGREEGIKEGRKEEKGKCIRILVSLGLSDIEIANKMEISEEMVKKLKVNTWNDND